MDTEASKSPIHFSLSDWRKPIDQRLKKFFKARLLDLLKDGAAVELSTIPLYLYAIYSLDLDNDPKGHAAEARTKILTVVHQEMLHLSLVGNLMTAVESGPKLYDSTMVPTYGEEDDVILHSRIPRILEQCKKNSLERFLRIEAPYEPAPEVEEEFVDTEPADRFDMIPGETVEKGNPIASNYNSIGEFYRELEHMIRISYMYIEFGNVKKQFSPAEFFGSDSNLMVQVTSQETAYEALKVIIDQGEGSMSADIAHYQMFLGLYKNRELWKCLPVLQSPTEKMYSDFPFIKSLSKTFNSTYCYLLTTIEKCWKTDDAVMRRCLVTNMHVIMVDIMTPLANILVRQSVSKGSNAGPTFEFYDVSGNGVKTGDTDSEAKMLYIHVQRNIKDAIGKTDTKDRKALERISFAVERIPWPSGS